MSLSEIKDKLTMMPTLEKKLQTNDKIDILFVEDDGIIASGLVYALETEGYSITHCENVQTALDAIEHRDFALALLDLSLPDGSGFDICERIKKKSNTPVIFLTVVDDEGNTIKGLEMGADDYITKPFRVRELMARIKAVLRRTSVQSENEPLPGDILYINDVKIYALQGKVYKGETEIGLTALEYRLLLKFAKNKGQILTRDQLLEALWDSAGSFVNDNTLTVYIKRLREKLHDNIQEPEIIQTVRGLGYRAGGANA